MAVKEGYVWVCPMVSVIFLGNRIDFILFDLLEGQKTQNRMDFWFTLIFQILLIYLFSFTKPINQLIYEDFILFIYLLFDLFIWVDVIRFYFRFNLFILIILILF